MTSYEVLKALMLDAEKHQPDLASFFDVIPALRVLGDTPQDPVYHAEGDVWTHTQMVLQAMLEQKEYQQASEKDRFVLFWAALLHDIAKPQTTAVDPDSGRITQAGHSRRGMLDARILLWRADVPFDLREQICCIIGVHQLPFYALSDDQRDTPEFMVHKLSWELPLWKLCLVAKVDMLGRVAQDQQRALEDVELFRLMALEQECLYQPKAFADAHTRVQYFRGTSISPDYPYYALEGSDVVLMSGLPASGKDHWVAQHRPGWPVASYDDARKELNLRYGKNEGKVSHLVQERVKDWLRNKQPFVWNATHLSKEMRQNALDLLYAYHAKVTIVYLEQNEAELLRRNRKRDTTLTNAKLQEMLFKWEIPLPTEAHDVRYEV